MSGSTILIDRVPLDVVAATTHARAERLARRVRDAMDAWLPDALASACGRDLDRDPACVFIERVDVTCAVAASWSDEAIAHAFARQLAQTLLRQYRSGDAVVFRDRADFLAAFVAGLVDGRAFSRWWFAEFEGLRALPVSAALRTLICTERTTAWLALARLSPFLLPRAVSLLTDADAERALTAAGAIDEGELAPAGALLGALEAAQAALPRNPAARVMSIALLASRAEPFVSRRNVLAVRALATLLEAARAGRLATRGGADDTATLVAWCAEAGMEPDESGAARELDAGAVVAHVRPAIASAAGAEGTEDAQREAVGHTRFGGALVLAVLLATLGWWQRWRDTLRQAGAASPDSLSAWAALAVTARALDPRHPGLVEDDAYLRAVFGVADAPRLPERRARRLLAHALWKTAPATQVATGRRLEPRLCMAARALLAELARRLPGCEGSTPRYLRTQCLTLGARVSADGTRATLGPAPLDVLLLLSGLKRADVQLPDGRRLVVSEDALP